MSKKQTEAPLGDRGWFDGSADPNPGGRIGIGWLLQVDGEECSGAHELPAHPDNSNNQAEYRAAIALLEAYLANGGKGPLLVHGDSQLIIRQLTGEYAVSAPGLYSLYERALELVDHIPGEVAFAWIPRAQNAVADGLASGRTLAQARAAADPGRLIYATRLPAPSEVPAALAATIARLNQQGSLSFKDAMRLRVGGRDVFSSWTPDMLKVGVGDEAFAIIEAALGPGAPQHVACRWALRGLAVQLACRKVKVDAEISANAEASPPRQQRRAPTSQ